MPYNPLAVTLMAALPGLPVQEVGGICSDRLSLCASCLQQACTLPDCLQDAAGKRQ